MTTIIDVFCGIYKLGAPQAAIQWMFQMRPCASLAELTDKLRRECYIAEKASTLGIKSFDITVHCKKKDGTLKGKVYSVDTDQQWQLLSPGLHREDNNLIGISLCAINTILC